MNEFQLAIAVGAIVTAFAARKLPHAWLWISLGAAIAVACDIYYAYNLPYPAAFTLACDALICLSIHWFSRERWELGVYIVFQFSVLISVARLGTVVGIFNAVDSEDTYRLALELVNWAGLAMIFGTAILGGAGGYALRSAWLRYVRGAYRYLRSAPQTDHWRRQ